MAISAGSTISASDIKFGTMVKKFTEFKKYRWNVTWMYRAYVDVPWTDFGCTASRKTCVLFTAGVPFGESQYEYCQGGTLVYGYDDSTATNCRIYAVSVERPINYNIRFSYWIVN